MVSVRPHLFIVVLLVAPALLALTASAATYTAGPFSYTILTSASQTTGPATSTSHSSTIGLLYQVARAQAPSSAGTPHSVGVGWGGLVRHIDANGSVIAEVQIGPGLSDKPITVTETVTQVTTTTTTIIKTVTGPGGEVRVITEVQTVTVPVDDSGGGASKTWLLLPLGLAAAALLFLIRGRG